MRGYRDEHFNNRRTGWRDWPPVSRGIKKALPEQKISAVGTNALATQAMIKAGADTAATGENAVLVGCRRADIIVGTIGIAVADSLWGEITPKMATAVGQSNAVRILLPMNICSNFVVGTSKMSAVDLVDEAVIKIKEIITKGIDLYYKP